MKQGLSFSGNPFFIGKFTVTGLEWIKKHTLTLQRSVFYKDLDVFWAKSDLEYLLEEITGITKNKLWSTNLSEDTLKTLEHCVSRLVTGEPMARILGYTYFNGLKILTGENVLIPRPDTEILVEKAFEFLTANVKQNEEICILDLCTGTACISIALAESLRSHGFERFHITATDISGDAVELARKNIKLHQLDTFISVEQQDLWPEYYETKVHNLVVSNPPYLSDEEFKKSHLGRYEPELALASGAEGLDLIRRMLQEGQEVLPTKTPMLIEHGYKQADQLFSLSKDFRAWKWIGNYKDLSERPRVSMFILEEGV